MIITLFKADCRQRLADAFGDAVVSVRGGSVNWNPDPNQSPRENGAVVGWIANTTSVTSILVDSACYDVFTVVEDQLQVPSIHVLFQEKSFWEFQLWHEGHDRVRFSVCPEQWGEVDPASQVGTPQDLADIWSVPVERIDKYMVNWQLEERWIEGHRTTTPYYHMRGKKAYPDDECEYGDMYQGFDFIRSLGGIIPGEGGKFLAYLPPIRRQK